MKLETLELYKTAVADLTPLAGLTALRKLDLHGVDATDLAPITTVTGLEYLDIANMPVETLAPLAGLTSLRELAAQGGKYLDVEPLVGLTSLVSLDIGDTHIADLAPLAGMTALESLRITWTDVEDLSPLAGLPIRRFYANGALISDLSAVATFPTPFELELIDNTIVDVDPLLTAAWSVPDLEQGCLDVLLNGNPLSATALNEVLPAVCAATAANVTADGLVMCEGHSCNNMP